MKKLMYWAIATMLVIGIGGYAFAGEPIVSVTPMVKMEKDAEVYRNAPAAGAFLVPGQPGDLSQAIRYNRDVFSAWGNLSAMVRTGKPVEPPALIEIAPGIDLDHDVLRHMDFRPTVAENLKIMDTNMFK